MSSQLGPIEVCCDAPPYAMVAACEGLGFQTPLDVRWCRLVPERKGAGITHSWKSFFGLGRARGRACSCGAPLPALARYEFFAGEVKEADYFLGQCRHCRTIYWKENTALPGAWHGSSWWGF
jgi:hypothetical protein